MGVAMDTLKNCDRRNRVSPARNSSQRSFRTVDQTDRTSTPSTDQGKNSVHRLTFAEDFMMEHSFTNLRFAVVGIKGSSRTVHKQAEAQPSAQYFGFPS
jgi:hypothetical protein